MDEKLLKYFKGDEFTASTWLKKYAVKDENGITVETDPYQMFDRLAKEFARIENNYNEDDKMSKDEIFELFKDFKYIVPGGSVMSGLGSEKLVSFSNCFVIDSPCDSYESIMKTRAYQVQLMSRRGGVGYDLSKLRPSGARVNNAAMTSTGAASYMDVNSAITNEVAQCIEGNQRVLTPFGMKPIKDVVIGDLVWTRVGFVKVINTFDNGIRAVYKTTTKFGHEIETTDDHIFLTCDYNGLIEKKISDFVVDEPICMLNGCDIEREYQVLTHTQYNPIPRPISNQTGTFGEMVHNRTLKTKIPTILDEKLAYLIGYAIGDGYTYERHSDSGDCIMDLTVSCNSNDTEIIDKIIKYTKDVFDVDVVPNQKNGENCVRMRIVCNEGCVFLKENGLLKPKTEFLRVPQKIFESNTKVQMAFFSGLFDADGYASGRKKGYTLTTVNENLKNDVQKLLLSNGIMTKCHVEESKHINWKTKYIVTIVGKYNQQKIVDFCTESVKINSLKFISKRDNYLSPYTKKSASLVKESFIPNTGFISVNALSQSKSYNCEILTQDYFKSIEYVGEKHVYDIELETEHLFWCEGFYVHNCGRRGALMLTMSISHPDVEEFISKKQDLTKVTGANISVKVTDEFMQAVKDDTDYVLRFPVDTNLKGWFEIDSLPYNELVKIEEDNNPKNRVYLKRIKAKDLWDKLVHCAWNTAEPGVIFEDRMHNYAPDGVYDNYKMVSTNPCVSGDTMLNTSIGKMTIKELVDLYDRGHSGITVESWNINRHVAEMQVVKFAQLTQHNANLIKITTDNGNTLRLTLDHMVYTIKNGYQEAKCLVEGDELLVYDNDTRMYVPNKVVSITQDGCEDVYDIGVEYNHNFFANGILVHNCGEIGMNKDSCRLIAMNLTGYVENPFTPNAKFNYDLFKEHTYKAVKLGDDLVDLELEQVNGIIESLDDDETLSREIWSMLRDTAIKVRRLGLGFTGMGDMLAMMNLKYGSEESKGFLNTVLDTMFRTQLESEVKLAKSRGKFEEFDAVLEGGKDGKEPQNDFFKFIHDNYNDIWNDMMVVGRRNISWSTLAPCGTISILTKTTSGVEPLFMPFYERKRKCMSPNDRVDYIDKVGEKYQLFVIVHEGLKRWANIAKGISFDEMDNFTIDTWKELYQESPYYMACAQDLDWSCRNDMQSVIQCYTSHSISSTCNLANDVTEGIVSDLYFDAWEKGLKGTTIYRDGCREGVLTQISKKREDDKFDESYVNAPKRPKSLEADFYTTKVKGEIFYVMIGLYHNKPYEIFVYRAGSDAKVVKNHKGVITKVKKNHYKFDSDVIKLNDLASKLNTEELATVLYSSMLMRTGANIKYIVKTSKKVDENISSFTSAMNRIISKYIPVESVDGEVCPQCGGKIIRENGCQHCADCDWSKCG